MIIELCRQEGIKLFSQKYPWLLIGVVLAVESAYLVLAVARPAETSLDVINAPLLWAQGVGWALRFGSYVVLVVGAMGISQEFAQGTVKMVLMLPIRRREWVTAKLLALVLLAWLLLLAMAALAAVIVSVTPGWSGVQQGGVALYSTGQVGLHLLVALGLTAVFLLPLCAFALLVGAYFHTSGAAVGVALLLGIVLETGAEMVDAGRWLFFHHLHRPVAQVLKLGKGLPFEWGETAAWGLAVTLVSFVVLAAWLTIRLERLDITD